MSRFRAQVPFAEYCGHVTVLLHESRNRQFGGFQSGRIQMPCNHIDDPHTLLVAACEQCRASGTAHRAVGVKICKPDSLSSHPVDARRLDPAIVKAHITTTKIVSQDNNDIGTPHRVIRGHRARVWRWLDSAVFGFVRLYACPCRIQRLIYHLSFCAGCSFLDVGNYGFDGGNDGSRILTHLICAVDQTNVAPARTGEEPPALLSPHDLRHALDGFEHSKYSAGLHRFC